MQRYVSCKKSFKNVSIRDFLSYAKFAYFKNIFKYPESLLV